MVGEQRWNWPLRLLEKVLHGLHLLEVARHICGQHHLYHQSPQLPGRGIRHEEKLTALCCKGNITSSSCLDDRLHNQSLFNFSSRMRDDFLPDLHAEVTSLLVHYISEFRSPSLSQSSLQLSVSLSLAACACQSHWPPVIFGEVVENVHFVVVLQKAVRSTDVVALQHWAVIVQDGCVWSVRERNKKLSQLR